MYWLYNPVWVLAPHGFVTDFCRAISPTPNPQHGGPGTTLRLAPTVLSVWHKGPYQELTLSPANLFESLGMELPLHDKAVVLNTNKYNY